ncbi:Uncharacterized protein Adt_27467 [Abeliophyllum distichum]|uniref:Uncharacterized protein n=1 Tax=Abeliophyllum distichum TaxID=126358 RepID=A0ABD1RTU1_9LAMI
MEEIDEREKKSVLNFLAIPCRLLRFIVPFGCPLCNGLALFRTFTDQTWRLFTYLAGQGQILCDLILTKLAAQAVKPVILGPPLLNHHRHNSSSKERKMEDVAENAFPSPSNIEEKNHEEEIAQNTSSTLADAPQAKAPKKMVSFNKSAEEILPNTSRRIKRIGSDTLGRTKQDQKDKEPAAAAKPLKSILKVGSKVHEN